LLTSSKYPLMSSRKWVEPETMSYHPRVSSNPARITHVFFDIGGVLGTNGWDRGERAGVCAEFGLDEGFETRHEAVIGEWETGRMTMDEYLDRTVFCVARPFRREDFVRRMKDQSRPFPDTLDLVRRLAGASPARRMALNNEPAELNLHRIERFGLAPLLEAFLSSCWLGDRKPDRRMYEKALAIAQAQPGRTLLIDDRKENLVPARELGFDAVHFTGAPALESELARRGLLEGG
jgi:putative hydrolase of the HAD superfamily